MSQVLSSCVRRSAVFPLGNQQKIPLGPRAAVNVSSVGRIEASHHSAARPEAELAASKPSSHQHQISSSPIISKVLSDRFEAEELGDQAEHIECAKHVDHDKEERCMNRSNPSIHISIALQKQRTNSIGIICAQHAEDCPNNNAPREVGVGSLVRAVVMLDGLDKSMRDD